MKSSRRRLMFAWTFMAVGCAAMSVVDWPVVEAQAPGGSRRDARGPAEVVDGEIRRRLAEAKVQASPAASDAEFLRRASLDLTGRLPRVERVVAFLESKSATKRTELIDELLASPEFGRHIAGVWTRRILAVGTPGANDTGVEFRDWLASEIDRGAGWDAIVRSMLTTTGNRTPTNFFVDANTDDGKFSPALLTGVTTQLFLGVQVQCAECHNHPFTELKQTDFWGLAAFFSRTSRSGGDPKKAGGPSQIQEGAKGGAVVGKANPKAKKKGDAPVAAKIDAGLPAIVIPNSGGNKGSGKVVPVKFLFGDLPMAIRDGDPSKPLRPHLADWIASPKNPFFAKNAVNWAWSHLFGRGLIDPIDDMDKDSTASHPQALKALTDEFVASGFDLRHLFRCICSTEAYGRASEPLPGNKDDVELFSHVACKTIAPEVFHDMLLDVLSVKSLKVREAFQPSLAKDGKKNAANLKKSSQPTPREAFVKAFTTERNPDKQTEFSHGIPQMLRLMNGREWTAPVPRVEQLVKEGKRPEEAIDHLYLASLSRRPDAKELRVMLDYVGRQPSVEAGYSGVLWILVNSSEFQLNH